MGQSREAARRVLPSSDRRESSKKGVLPAEEGWKRAKEAGRSGRG